MPTDAEKYRILSQYLPSEMILDDQLTYCQINRSEQTQAIDKFRKALVAHKIINNEPSALSKSECLLKPEWNGNYDFLDEGDEQNALTKPSIGWTCQSSECHIESDLPVPKTNEVAMVKDIKELPKCCITEIHEHEETHTRKKTAKGYKLVFTPERHIHVVCKGVHPSKLGWTVNKLANAVLKNRGHEELE